MTISPNPLPSNPTSTSTSTFTVPDPTPEKIYLLFRVFHVETNPELCIYLDPWALFKQKELFLCAEGFSVTPNPGESSWVVGV
jgi:hypothetical protein